MNACFASTASSTAKHKDVWCWASRWAKPGSYDHSRCNEMVCNIRKTCHRPLSFPKSEMRRPRWELPKCASLMCNYPPKVAVRKLYFSAGQCFSAVFKSSYSLFEHLTSKVQDREGRTTCLASMFPWSDLLPFISSGSYQIKVIFTAMVSMGPMMSWKIEWRLIHAESRQFN